MLGQGEFSWEFKEDEVITTNKKNAPSEKGNYWTISTLLNSSRPNPGRREKTKIFIFKLLCSASKGFMKAFKAFMKPFKAPQRTVKIKISNIYVSTTFWNTRGWERLIFRWFLRNIFMKRLAKTLTRFSLNASTFSGA